MIHQETGNDETSQTARAQSLRKIQTLERQVCAYQQRLKRTQETLSKAQQEFAEKIRQYDEIFDASPLGYLTLKNYDTILDGNLTCAEMLGVRKEHLSMHLFTEFIVHDDLDVYHVHRRQLLKVRDKLSSEIRLKRLDGSVFPAQLDSLAIQGGSEDQARFRVAMTDLSKYKQQVKSLWESEFRYGTMFDGAGDMIVIYDLNGRLHEANRVTCEHLGYTREELWHMTIMDIDAREDECCLSDHIEELRRKDSLLSETSFLCRDGARIDIEASRRLITYSGNPAVLCIGRDIRRRKRAEEALRESEQRYKRITDAVTDYIYTVRLSDGVPEATIHRPSSVAVTGYSPEEFEANPYLWINMVYMQDRQSVKQQADNILVGKPVKPLEHRIVRKDGVIRWVKNTCVPHYDEQGRLMAYDGLIQDISERKQAEEALRASEQRFRTVANFTYDWETWVGPSRHDVYISPSCERISGYPPEAFYQDSNLLIKITHPDDYERVRNHLQQEFQNNDVHFIDFRIVTANGEKRWLSHICQTVYSPEGVWLGRRASNRDITERKLAEAALQESEARYHAMIQAFDGFIYVCNSDYRIEFMNQQLIERTGYDGTGDICYEALHGLSELCPWCVNEQVFRGETVRWEVLSPRDKRWYYIVNTPLYHADKRISKQALIMDITSRKQAEEALRESEERYRQLVELCPDAILVHQQNRYIYSNAAGMQLLAASTPEELLGRSIFDVVRPQYHANVAERIKKAYNDDNPSPMMEEKYVRLDGQEMDVEVVGGPILYQGRPAIQIVFRDITLRKRAEDALRKSEEHYRSLFEDSPISLWEEDFSQVKQYLEQLRKSGITDFAEYFKHHPRELKNCVSMVKILNINKATLTLYETQNKQEFYQGLHTFFTQKTYDLFLEELVAIAEGKTALQKETVNFTVTGEKLYVELHWRIAPGYEETLSKVLVSIVNITARKRAEQQLHRTMVDLKRSNADLEQFAYAASHDLQQPLLMIDCYIQLLNKRYHKKLGEDADEFLTGIIYGVDRMQSLIRDLLEYARLNRIGTDIQSVDCAVVFKKAVQNLQSQIEEQHVEITHTPFPTIMGHTTQLVRLFQNLLSNAIKFRRDVPPRIHISIEQRNQEWLFAIEDNGIGIDQKHLERIFVVFERLHSADEYPGTGIGLAVCKKIVEQYGGQIWVESEPGKGTTFYFTSPGQNT